MFNRFIFAAVGVIVAGSLAIADEKVRITNGEWKPYLSKSLPENGAASLIVKEAFAAAGVPVEYGFFPWKRAFRLAKEGVWDGSVVWVRTPERDRDFLFSDVVIAEPEYLFHLKSAPLDWTYPIDLRGLKIGGTLHTVYPVFDPLDRAGIIRIERAGTYEELFRRLLAGRIDAIPQVLNVGSYLIRTTLSEDQQKRITFSPTPIQTREYRLMLSKAIPENTELLERFNGGLQRVRDTGRYDEIMRNLAAGHFDRR